MGDVLNLSEIRYNVLRLQMMYILGLLSLILNGLSDVFKFQKILIRFFLELSSDLIQFGVKLVLTEIVAVLSASYEVVWISSTMFFTFFKTLFELIWHFLSFLIGFKFNESYLLV